MARPAGPADRPKRLCGLRQFVMILQLPSYQMKDFLCYQVDRRCIADVKA